MSRRILGLLLSLLAATPALAQDARVIDPGMTREQVVAVLGAPVMTRTAGRFIYLFYPNGCERTCGMQDLVILEDDAVVDAIFRSPRRSYSGTSSSPGSAAPGRTAGSAAVRSSLGGGAGSGSIIMANPTPGEPAPPATPTIRRSAGATTTGAAPAAAAANPNPARAEQLLRAPHDSAVGTPQTPALGSPVPRDSSYVPGVQLRPGEKPVPFQGARPSPADSARRAQARQQSDTTQRPPE